MIQYLHEILYLLGDDKRKLPALVVLFWILSLIDLAGLGLIAPYIAIILNPPSFDGGFGQFTKMIGLPQEQKELIILIGLILLVLFLFRSVFGVWINKLIFQFSQQRQVKLRCKLLWAYQNMPYTEYLKRNSSDYIHSINNLTGQYTSGVVLVLLKSMSDGIVAILILGYLAWNTGFILLIMICFLGVIIVCYDRFFRNILQDYGKKLNETSVRILKGVQESMGGLKEVRILGKESYFYQAVLKDSAAYANYHTTQHVISTSPRYFMEALIIGFMVLLIIGSLFLGHDLQSLVPTLGMYGVASMRLFPIANLISGGLVSLRFSRNSVARLYQDYTILEEVKPLTLEGENSSVAEPFSCLYLDKVSFGYLDDSQMALRDICFEIREGDSIGIIGASGAGKTTLLDVFLGLLEPQKGDIIYNGESLITEMACWRSHVAYLPQQVFLLDNTLRRNVALGIEDIEIDDDLVYKALRKSRLLKLTEQLPNGVDTLLGEGGVRLSGGQRQRVALARAFYHGRNVLVMDEATSSLDNETEKEIIEEIKHLKGEKTIIVIAHRLSTVQHCNRIYRLENGRIVEQGTYNEVVQS